MKLNTRSVVVGVLALASIIAAAVVMQPANIPSASAAGVCAGIEVKSNLSTTWTITGPGGVSVVDPNGPAPSMGFANNKSSTGGTLPWGEYTIQVQPTVPGGKTPYINLFIGGNPNLTNVGPGRVTFICGGWSHYKVTYMGDITSGGVLQYKSTPLDFDSYITSGDPNLDFPQGHSGKQMIYGGAVVGNHFVFQGSWCVGNMHSQLAGSGLWSMKEDGTAVQERQVCIDLGAGTNFLPSQSMNLGGSVRAFANNGSDFLSFGHDAITPSIAVYYGFSGDQMVIKSRSPTSFNERFLQGVNGEGSPSLSDGYVVDSKDGSIYRLSDWEKVGISPIKSFFSLGNYLVGDPDPRNPSTPRVYKMQNEQVVSVGELPGNIHTHSNFMRYVYDFSKSPAQLVAYDTGMSLGSNIPTTPPRLIWYKVGSSGLELVKEINVADDLFWQLSAVWGDYLILSTFDGGRISIRKVAGSAYTEVQVIVLPNGGKLGNIIVSPAGYVAIIANEAYGTPSAQNSSGSRTQVHIYKFGGAPTTSDPLVPLGPFPTSTPTQIPGQSLSVVYSTTSTPPTPPKILIRMTNILSVSPTSLSISIFGHTYTVDASHAKTYNMNWALTTLSSFSPGFYVNVWGTLDLQDSTLIHAINIRNPLPPGTQTNNPTVAPFTAPAQTPASTAATQNQLNTLQEALRALQLRLGQ